MRGRSRHVEPGVSALIAAVFALLLLFVAWPLARVLATGFMRDGAPTLEHYRALWTGRTIGRLLFNSIALAATVGLAGTVVGATVAYAIVMVGVPFRRAFRFVATLPMIAPPFMLALAAIMLFGRNGVITRAVVLPLFGRAPEIYGFGGLVLVQTLTYFPTALLLMLGVWAALDPRLEEAAQSQGARPWAVFRGVVLPLAMPGLLSAFLLLFIESLADFGNPLILGGDFQVLSVAAFLKITGEFDTAGGAALATLLLVPAASAYFVQKLYVERKSHATLLGKPASTQRARAPRGARIAALSACALVAAAVVLFFGAVAYGSFVEVWRGTGGFTVEHYRAALSAAHGALTDSLLLAAIATPLAGSFGMAVAWLLVRRRFRGRSLMAALAMLTFAVPGTVIGIGYVLAFNQPPLQLTGTAAIIVLLFLFRSAPIGIEAGSTAIRQIDPAIEEGSASLGGSPLATFRHIVLPLIAPAFFAGLAHAFVRSVTAISAVIFVVSGQWNLLTVSILGFVENSDLSRAAALCMMLTTIVAAVLLLMQLAVLRMGGRR